MSSPLVPASLIGIKLGNYRIERLLGRGRMGLVYLARDEALLRPIAVKVLSWSAPEAQSQNPEAWLLSEARNIARVSHPGVIQVYGVAKHGPYAYIAMEYVDGVSADRFIEERGPMAPGMATEILLQIATALQAAHECDVIHRDVKPANILIRSDGSAKLGDFGMAIHDPVPSPTTTGHTQVGTPLYTAPEIWAGAQASPATDLYALGATYHQLLTGHPPFEAADLPSLINAHQHQEPPLLAGRASRLPEPCLELLQRCLAKLPSDRIASAQALTWMARGALRSLERSRPGTHSAPPSSARVRVPHDALGILGLSQAPFADLDSVMDLESFEPFQSIAVELRACLGVVGASVHFLGQPGSGRAPLLRSLLTKEFWPGPQAWVEVNAESLGRSLEQRVCRAFGALPSTVLSNDSALEGLLEHLGGASKAGAALLVVEASVPLRAHARDLEAISRAASSTGYFSVVVLGGFEAGQALIDPAIVTLPPFLAPQLLIYLRTRISRAQEAGRTPLLVTPDAALLLQARSGGNLKRVNRIATRMLGLAAIQRARVLTSSLVWAAANSVDGVVATVPSSNWPPRDVLTILNGERLTAGVEPREPKLEFERLSEHEAEPEVSY